MKNTQKEKRPLKSIAGDYFTYIGRHLPQQCASDEFYFLPRAEVAIQHLDSLDDLTPGIIQDHIRYVQGLLSEISADKRDDLEEEIDRLLLKQSMESFIREFDDAEGWRNDPTLYVKIPLFAMDQVLSRRDSTPDHVKANLSTIFAQIPSFLRLAVRNLGSPPEISLQVALNMAQDAIHFHGRDIRSLIEERIGENTELVAKNREVLEAWERYKRELLHLPSRKSFAIGEDGLEKILAVSLGYPRHPKEILEIAQHAYQETQKEIRKFASNIDSRKTWELIVYEQLPSICSPEEFLRLFHREVQSLRRFFYSQDIITFPSGEKIAVLQTPNYLKSLRATASYRAPLTGNTRGHGIFYITPGREDLELISSHRPYLSAHETYPGHHILDHLRIHHSNPIRRQIESPLFYEGWACYGEQLLNELGYVKDPRQQLIHLKRLLWRSLRAVVDVELQTGKITLAQAAKKMETFGFSAKRTQRQMRRFALTPGYQLCYFMGMYEINRLRKQFSSRLGPKPFHDILLGGGEIPFHLVEKRLEASLV
ncbi:MAG: DUF885 family protein [Syntrophobacterales bacterium]|nr:MAG: DUF885 family protein [Syntrophobacterales bacterium]